MPSKKQILVTGGRGGIGSEIVRALSASPQVESIITLGQSPVPADLESDSNVIHEQGSILDEEALERTFNQNSVTHLIHAAGARTSACANNPLLGFETNVFGTDRVFRAARACSTVRKVIHFSSAAVYGGQTGELSESAQLAPASPYAISKAASEMAALGHGDSASFQTIILRPGFVLAAETRTGLGEFITHAMTGDNAKLTFPEQFFLHWTPDLAAAVVRLIDDEVRSGIIHPPGETFRLEQFAAAVEQYCRESGRKPEIELNPQADVALPRDLNFDRFVAVAGELSTTPLPAMIKAVADLVG